MALVTSTFSKRIKVMGEERELEMLFEALKCIRALDVQVHDELIALAHQIVILDETDDPIELFVPPCGILIRSGQITLLAHPKTIRIGKYWCAGFIVFQTALLGIVKKMNPQALRNMDQFFEVTRDIKLMRQALEKSVLFLKHIEAPSPDIQGFERMAAAMEPLIIVPAVTCSGPPPMVDMMEPMEGLPAGSGKTLDLVLRKDKEQKLLAKKLGLSKEYSGHVFILPTRKMPDGTSQHGSLGLLARVDQYDPIGRITFHENPVRCKLLDFKETDGITVARVHLAPDPQLSANSLETIERLRTTLGGIRQSIINSDNSPHNIRVPAQKELPQSAYALMCRAIRLLQLSGRGNETALFARSGDWLARVTLGAAERAIESFKRGEFGLSPRKEGREILSAEFSRWFEKLGPIAFHKQSRFSRLIENMSGWNCDIGKGTLTIGSDLEFRVQILATHSFQANDWLWSWANRESAFPQHAMAAALQLKELGIDWKIPELASPRLDFDDASIDADSSGLIHALAMISTALTGADAYYPCKSGERGCAVLLVFDDRKHIPLDCGLGSIANEVSLRLPEALMTLNVPCSKAVVEEYLRYFAQSLNASSDGLKTHALFPDNSCLEVTYTADGALAGLSSVPVAVV